MDHSTSHQQVKPVADSSQAQPKVQFRVLEELNDLRTRARRETDIDELKAEVYSKIRGIERIFAGVA